MEIFWTIVVCAPVVGISVAVKRLCRRFLK